MTLLEGSCGTLSPQLKEKGLYSMESLVQQQPMWFLIPPEFSGEHTENPETFIENYQSFDERLKNRAATRCILGDAAK
jgi:hypothetical protein